MMSQRLLSVALCALLAIAPSCRFGYELLTESNESSDGTQRNGDGDGDGDLGGASTAGDGDGGDGDGDSGDGDSGDGDRGVSGGSAGDGDGDGDGAGGGADGGTGSGSGGDGSGGDGSGGDGSGGQIAVDFLVTTAADEQDPNPTVENPGGSGLSLREALQLANSLSGHQSIGFESDFSLTLTEGVLPAISESVTLTGPVDIDGSGVGGLGSCLEVTASDVTLDSIAVLSCAARPLQLSSAGSSNNQVLGCLFYDGAQAVRVVGTDAVIERSSFVSSRGRGLEALGPGASLWNNRFESSGAEALFVGPAANGISIVGNLFFGNSVAIKMGAVSGVNLWFNTIAKSSDIGIVAGVASQVSFANNLITHSTNYGITVAGDFDFSSHNLYFENLAGHCDGCSLGASALTSDPMYQDLAADVYLLTAASPARDSGLDMGVDRVLDDPVDYHGVEFDRGFMEFD
jgi:CSLREA domain-containing protein